MWIGDNPLGNECGRDNCLIAVLGPNFGNRDGIFIGKTIGGNERDTFEPECPRLSEVTIAELRNKLCNPISTAHNKLNVQVSSALALSVRWLIQVFSDRGLCGVCRMLTS